MLNAEDIKYFDEKFNSSKNDFYKKLDSSVNAYLVRRKAEKEDISAQICLGNPYFNLGNYYFSKTQYQKAAYYFALAANQKYTFAKTKLQNLEKGHPGITAYAQARILCEEGKYDEALTFYHQIPQKFSRPRDKGFIFIYLAVHIPNLTLSSQDINEFKTLDLSDLPDEDKNELRDKIWLACRDRKISIRTIISAAPRNTWMPNFWSSTEENTSHAQSESEKNEDVNGITPAPRNGATSINR